MTRVVNCKYEKYDIYIGRGSPFGNPFTHLPLERTKAKVQVGSRDESIQACEDWLDGTAWNDIEQERRTYILEHLVDLEDKILGCYCKPLRCHGDIYVKMIGNMQKEMAR